MIAAYLSRFINFFYDHLYTDLAWMYDAVAWLVSFGRWTTWQRVAIPFLPTGRILEVGCGPGHLLEVLRAGSTECFGIDRSAQMTRIAATNLRAVGSPGIICKAEAEHLPFARGSFSGAVSTFPSEYIIQAEAIEEIRRVLRNSGQLIVVFGFRIIGSSLVDRCLRILFKLTHQSIEHEISQLEATEVPGFIGRFERVLEADAEVICWVGSRSE